MCDEGYAISQVQATEAILKSQNITIHSDGTSRDTKKVVSEQISTGGNETLFLGFTPVATEDASTLLEVTLNSLKRLADSSCEMLALSPDELLQQIQSRISSTMSDRASAMKLWGKKLEEHLQEESTSNVKLNFLHCNAHFLLGLSSKCEKSLLESEAHFKSESDCSLGRDRTDDFFKTDSESSTSRLIRTACEVLGPRGDQKCGRHHDWMTFCPDSNIPSFKSNRFNCFFEAAAALIYHLKTIRLFFSSGTLDEDNLNKKLKAVAMDVDDDQLMCFVCAVALFYLKVTGPYWVLVNSDVLYADFHMYVKMMFSNFQLMSENPSLFLDRKCLSVFENQFPITSPMWESVHAFSNLTDNSAVIENILSNLAKDCIVVTEKQLSDFLPGGKFENVDDSSRRQISHCPLTNLIGESSFGDFDYDMSKRRGASLHNRSANHVIKRNGTVGYITKKPEATQSLLFSHAKKMGKQLRKDNRAMEMKVVIDTKQKFADNQSKKIAKLQAALSRHSKAVDSVKDHGGPCGSPEDVDDLVAKLRSAKKSDRHISEVLKSEIRYQKEMYGQKLKFGDLKFMVSTLKKCLSPVDEPPLKKSKHN